MDVTVVIKAQSVIRFLPRDWRTGSSGRSDIPRCRAVGISEPIESGIAINAAEQTDCDCAELFPAVTSATLSSSRRMLTSVEL
jgi:hypothetical protein